MSTDTLLVYFMISFFYIISPGPAVFLAITNGITANMKMVMVSSLGNILGLFALSTISILGLGALLLTSALLFTLVKIVGAGYLIYLGIRQIIFAKKINLDDQGSSKKHRNLSTYFYESFFIAITNPKPILFFIALFPQFLNTSQPLAGQFLTLTFIFMSLSFLSLCAYGLASRSIRGILFRNNVMQWFHRITGGLFILMGLSLLKLKNNTAN
ncbi:MAG: LysE family translocator [Cellvibrionaceae bacterium]